MTFTDIMTFLAGWTGASVVAVGVYAVINWRRNTRAEKAFQELDAGIIEDIQKWPDYRLKAEIAAAEARAVRDAHGASAELADNAIRARNEQLRCEMRLRAAGHVIQDGKVA
jgi:hypothetical protein